jgi:hypothetical protein
VLPHADQLMHAEPYKLQLAIINELIRQLVKLRLHNYS